MDPPIVTFVYASQTGNCEEISLDMYNKAKELGYESERFQFDDHGIKFDFSCELPVRIAVLIVSSTGDGEPPDNGAKFYRFLRNSEKQARTSRSPKDKIFSHLPYTILGLGDSDYQSFHKCPKDVQTAFECLGAKLFNYFGKADEATGLESEVEPWKKRFWQELPKVIEACSNLVSLESPALVASKTFMENTSTKLVENMDEDYNEDEKIELKAKIVDSKIVASKYRKVLH